MNLHEIEQLIARYFEGETTLSEEQQLREFFRSGNIPEKWKSLEIYFNYIDSERSKSLDEPSFDEKIMAAIQDGNTSPIFDLHKPWIYWISGVAASILILAAVFIKFDPFSNRIGDTYSDPEMAYSEAKKILFYVSSKFQKGTKNLEAMETYEVGLNDLKPVAAYSKALKEVNRVDEVEKVNKMITNN